MGNDLKRAVVDLDGTLCTQQRTGTYHLALPIVENIEAVNRLKEAGWHITIFTARGMRTYNGDVERIKEIYQAPVTAWLEKHGVRYDVLKFGKPPADLCLDDRAIDELAFRDLALSVWEFRSPVGRVVQSGRPIVFTNGVFDLFHPGHRKLLQECKKIADEKGGIVVVGLNSDSSVRRLKGPSRPVIPFEDRAALLGDLPYVDFVLEFDDDTPLSLITRLKPVVIVKGSDYKADEVVGSTVAPVHLVDLDSRYSTSKMLSWETKK